LVEAYSPKRAKRPTDPVLSLLMKISLHSSQSGNLESGDGDTKVSPGCTRCYIEHSYAGAEP
jgi:hypothetical protein